jgi:chloramphenicol-sensitive protein RarD
VVAYLWWGLIPLYFKLVIKIPPLTVLAHRVIWSFIFLAVLCAAMTSWRELRETIRSPRNLIILSISTLLLATNWGVFIFAVSTGRVLQSSLGYFTVPLVTVALAITVLKERLRRRQAVGLALAVVGVLVLTIARRQPPWIALTLAISWGGYGLSRKITHIRPLVGVMVETALLVPIAAGYIMLEASSADRFHLTTRDFLLLMLAGIITAMPLLWFAAAARRLRLITLGFLQYLAPIGQFLLAVFAFGEKFDAANFCGFACIWAALIAYSIDSLRAYRAASSSSAELLQPAIES